MKICVKLPESFEVRIIDKSYDIKADFEFNSYEKEILTLNADIKAPIIVKNIFLNNIREFIFKCGFNCIVSFNKISIDLKDIKNLDDISYKSGEYFIELNN